MMTTNTTCPIACLANEMSLRTRVLRERWLGQRSTKKVDAGLGSTLMIALATLLIGFVTVASTVSVAAPLVEIIPVLLASLAP